MTLEEMSDFFTKRIEDYEEHMLTEVEGCREGYMKMAELIPQSTKRLLDLGCGTGLELDEIFKKLPHVKVTGIDLTQAMLDKLRKRHPDKELTLINANFFDYYFGIEAFDVAISFQALHHFSHEDKIALYTKVCNALIPNGIYIECDYMAPNQEYEDFYYKEYERLRAEMGLPDGVLYHYDTPCTVENQIKMLLMAGFSKVNKVWQRGNTVILVATKH